MVRGSRLGQSASVNRHERQRWRHDGGIDTAAGSVATAERGITALEQAQEIIRCRQDFLHWMKEYAFFLCKDRGHLKWQPWPIHENLIDTLSKSSRIIILKARQLGVSWAVAGYALWTAIFRTGQNVLLMSQGESEAQSLLDKARYIWRWLPDWMRPNLSKDNSGSMEFDDLDSHITALPSTQKAGRGEGTNLVICDEWAFHPYADANWAALQPTLGANARLIGVSTANGRGNLFHRIWDGAGNLSNGFRALFFGCWDAPERTPEWYEQQAQDYAATPHLLVQEHPRNASEAFISSGNCLFEVKRINEALQACKPPLETRLNGALKIWQRPMVGHRYVAGADVAEGKDAGNDRLDYSGVAIYDWKTCAHVADLHGQWPLDQFGQMAFDLGTEYNAALLGVERNNHGHAVLLVLKQLGYPHIYQHDETDDLRAKPGVKRHVAGWPTTAKTKPVLEQELGALIASGGILSYDAAFWDECLSYVNHGNGTTGAQDGCHDDRVIKHAIAMQMRKQAAPRRTSISLGARF